MELINPSMVIFRLCLGLPLALARRPLDGDAIRPCFSAFMVGYFLISTPEYSNIKGLLVLNNKP